MSPLTVIVWNSFTRRFSTGTKFALAICVSSVFLSGCSEPAAPDTTTPTNVSSAASGTSSTAAGESAKADSTKPSVMMIPASQLAIGDYLPPLDDGRVEVAAPAGWSPLPRSSDYLCRFFMSDRNGLPRIDVLVADSGDKSVTTNADNVDALVTTITSEAKSSGTKIIEEVIPIRVSEVFGARFVSYVKLAVGTSEVVAERQTVVTIQNGRRYTIQLYVLPETLKVHRDAGYSVFGGLKVNSVP